MPFIDLAIGFLLSFSPYMGSYSVVADTYQSGQQVCQMFPSLVAQENGAFVEVPLDYKNPSAGKLKLYYRFEVPFNSELPTLVVFNGGPGQGSHFGFLGDLEGYNVLLFDPRGVSCSRPEKFEDYQTASFYSSEAIARDVEVLRRHLGVQQWSIYGVSYGTVPATIYASLFPEATKITILEGVVYEGGNELWSGEFRRSVLQRALAKLQPEVLTKILAISHDYELHPSWLSLYARFILTMDNGQELLLSRLQECETTKGCDTLVEEFKTWFINPTVHPLYSMDSYIHSAIACQELGFSNPSLILYDELLSDGSFRPVAGATQKAFCEKLQGFGGVQIYQAKKYPIKGPVVYFQGLADGVTQSPQAFLHFREVAQGRAALFMAPQGGHSPNLMKIMKGDTQQRNLFLSVLSGRWQSVENRNPTSQENGWILRIK